MRVDRDAAVTCAGRDRHTAGTEAYSRLYIRFSGFRLVRPFFWGSVADASDPKGSRYKFLLNRTFFALLWYSIELFGAASALIDRRNSLSRSTILYRALWISSCMNSRKQKLTSRHCCFVVISGLDCSKWIDSRQDASATRLILIVLGYMSSRGRVQQFIGCGAPYDLKYNASDGRRPENLIELGHVP